jgi:uncharacterized protein (DUF1330 family)
MKPQVKLAIAIIAGTALGAAAVEGLHAQGKAKTPIYVITEIDVTNADGYAKEYSPKIAAVIVKAGGKRLAATDNVTSFDGQPPAKRVSIQLWESSDQYKAYRNSAEYKEVRKIGDKYAKFRTFSVEAMQ